MKKIFVFFLLVFIAALPEKLSAKSYYVAPYGDDGNPGTFDAPFAPVQRAHDNGDLQPGDVIYLRGGTYHPPQQTVFSKAGDAGNYYILRSYPGEVPVIDGQNIPEV